jgi:hypothetical protein
MRSSVAATSFSRSVLTVGLTERFEEFDRRLSLLKGFL